MDVSWIEEIALLQRTGAEIAHTISSSRTRARPLLRL